MIYISSSCVKSDRIAESVMKLAEAGFANIELSGGTVPYPNLEEDLLELKSRYDLNYLCHNYFPPPTVPFVLNLASLDESVASQSMEHCKKAIDLSKKLGARKIAFHAGFLINIPVEQIGKKISSKSLFPSKKAMQSFIENLSILKSYADKEVRLYIENNVLSEENFEEFEHKNPFFFTDSNNLQDIRSKMAIDILLDMAHLKVSCRSLSLNFVREAKELLSQTDYIHLSDNDGKRDTNNAIDSKSEILDILSQFDLNKYTITLETYSNLEEIRKSYDLIEKLS